MAVFFISYNLNGSSEKYEIVDKTIRSCSYNETWVHYIDNTWIIKSRLSVDEIGKRINSACEDEDAFIVVEATHKFSGWLPEEAFNYLYSKVYK